jgi:hypothetical protein
LHQVRSWWRARQHRALGARAGTRAGKRRWVARRAGRVARGFGA